MKGIAKVTRMALILLLLLGLLGCFLPEPTRCGLTQLLLTAAQMPAGWAEEGVWAPPWLDPEGAQDARRVALIHRDASEKASHTVYRYRNRWLAAFFFRFNRAVYLPATQQTWFPLAGSEGWGLGGDEQLVQCSTPVPLGTVTLLPRCRAVIRYGPFISSFGTPIGDPFMTREQFQALVQAVDARLRACAW